MDISEILPWVFLAFFAFWIFARPRDSEPYNLARLERKIDYLLRHFQLDPREAASIPFSDEVIALIKSGEKIAAIKQLRQETHLGLKEAKEAVEQYQQSGHTI
jgi:hypothetical protein